MAFCHTLGVIWMEKRLKIPVLVLAFALLTGNAVAQDPMRGQYVAQLGGCVNCHTEDKKGAAPFAGGRALKTPFGTFYGPNITPHPQAGIGRWSEADFIQAMRQGQRPDGAHYYPAFPYPSFTKIFDSDLKDLWSYLQTLPPSVRPSQEHELRFPFGFRILNLFWKWLFFTPGSFVNDQSKSQLINRGAYVVQALGHCSECHTARNFLGAPKMARYLAGGKGPDGKDLPNLTPTNLKSWNDAELMEFLRTGLTPDNDSANATMGEVIENVTSKMTPGDMDGVIAYLRSLPPIADETR